MEKAVDKVEKKPPSKCLTKTEKCVSRETTKKEDSPMHNKILNLIRVTLVCLLILIGTIAGHDHAEEPPATPTEPAEPTEKEIPTETTSP